jgi:hypothetical protein
MAPVLKHCGPSSGRAVSGGKGALPPSATKMGGEEKPG